MPVAARIQELSAREIAVLEGIDRRLPLKSIAAELGVSESRINQHVRALKERFEVNNLSDLVDAWRREDVESIDDDSCRNSAWRNPQVPPAAIGSETSSRVAPGEFVLSDAALYAIEAPWTACSTKAFAKASRASGSSGEPASDERRIPAASAN